jgi:hypothetical protein
MLIIPSILSTFTSLKDKTLKLVFETNEVTPEQMTNIAKNLQQFGYLAFKKEAFKQSDTDALKSLDTEYQSKGKSNSQRLRSVLWIAFGQNKKGYNDFNEYYDSEMNKIIEHYKNKLD